MTSPAVERLLDAPDDRAAWELFADELQAAGDLRGELIALALQQKNSRLAVRLKKAHHRFLGALDADFDQRVTATFVNGLWHTLEAADPPNQKRPMSLGKLVAALVENPMAVLLRALTSAHRTAGELERMLERIDVPALTSLTLAAAEGWNGSRALDFPRLRDAKLQNLARAETMRHARLEALHLFVSMEGCELEAIETPNLETLSVLAVGPFALPRLEAPKLKRLELPMQTGVTAWLRDAGAAGSIERVALSGLASEELAREWLEALPHFPALQRLAAWDEAPLEPLHAAIRERTAT